MSEAYSLEISTNVTENPYEKRFPSTMTLDDLKKKLELIVGAEASQISIDLLDSNGKFVAALTDNTRTLKDLGVKTNMRIHCVDTTHGNEDLKDDSMVEKYEMSDDKYEQREDSVRAFKKKMREQQGLAGGASPSANNGKEQENEEAAKNIVVGSRCEVRVANQMARRGSIAFIGTTKFKEGTWVGIKYDEPVGKNNGSVAGVRYFECDDKYGGFVRPLDVICGDFPELSIDDMEEI